MEIIEYNETYKQRVIDLIIGIQRDELGVKITVKDQPDLEQVKGFYQRANGNFWIALVSGDVVGTIALIDIGNNIGVLRKMFVAPGSRGREKGIAQQLLDTLLTWSRNRNFQEVYLGTINIMKAAHRFYEKNGFEWIEKEKLPAGFPVMTVDNIFYKRSFSSAS